MTLTDTQAWGQRACWKLCRLQTFWYFKCNYFIDSERLNKRQIWWLCSWNLSDIAGELTSCGAKNKTKPKQPTRTESSMSSWWESDWMRSLLLHGNPSCLQRSESYRGYKKAQSKAMYVVFIFYLPLGSWLLEGLSSLGELYTQFAWKTVTFLHCFFTAAIRQQHKKYNTYISQPCNPYFHCSPQQLQVSW